MIKVYLSNDGSTWISKYPSTSPYANQELSSFVEADNLRVYQQIAFATSSPTKMTITVGGYSSCLTPFKENKYIKVQEDSSVVFIGVEASSTETVTSHATRDLSIIYDDLSSVWRELKFGDIQSLEVTTSVVMPSSNPSIPFDAEQSKVVINSYITALDEHIARTGSNAILNQQLINEQAYWRKVLASYNGQGGVSKHELKVTKNDHIKVCDGTDKQHSMIHKLFALITDLQVDTSYIDTTEVKFFYAMDGDGVLDTICEFLAQNGLGWYVDYPTATIKVVPFDSSTTVTFVQNVEEKAQIKTDIKKFSEINEQVNAQYIADVRTIYNSPLYKMFDTHTKNCYPLRMISPWQYGETYNWVGNKESGRSYPREDRIYFYNGQEYNANVPQVGSAKPDTDVIVTKKNYFWEKRPEGAIYDKNSKSWRQYPDLYGVEGGDFFIFSPYAEIEPYWYSHHQWYVSIAQILVLYIDNDGTIKYSFASNKIGIDTRFLPNEIWRNNYSGFDYLRICGNISRAVWSSVDYADSYDGLIPSSQDATKLQYIYTADGMTRFRKANYWYRLSDAQSWTFSSCDEYSIMDALRISGVDDTYVLVTKKEKHLDDGTFKYTCVKAPTKEFSYNGQGLITNVNMPFDPTGFSYSINRVVSLDADGVPKGSSPVKVYVDTQYEYTTLSATYDDVELEINKGEGRAWFEIPLSMISQTANQGSIKNAYGDYETVKEFSIETVKDGDKGEQGAQGEKGDKGASGDNGDSAVIEYALGSYDDQPPVEKMYWNDEVMMWESEVMTWNEILWTTEVQTPSSGQYVWMRTRVGNSSWQYTRLTGEIGAQGEQSKVFSIECPIISFNSDKRNNDTVTINLSSNIQGYDSVIPTWSTTAGTVSPSTGLSTTLTFSKNNTSDVTITMTANGITPAVFVIHSIDITDYNKNWGTLTALPPIGDVFEGDYFIAGSNFDSYVLGKPYVRVSDRWDNLTANSVENTARLFSLLGNVMESDLTVPSTSAMYAWFGTLIAQDAAIQRLFSKNITILNNGSIHSDAYDDDGSYIGPGPGFYLGSDGVLKCNSANTSDLNAENANISGNSSFHGSFDCTVIKTTPESPSTYVTLNNGLVADSAQAKRIVDQMIAYGLISDYIGPQTTSPMFPIQVVGVSGISYMQVRYQGSNPRYSASVYFYDSSRNQVNIRNYVTCSKNAGNWSNQLWSTNENSSSVYYGQWASNGIEIRVLTGLNRLWVDVPTAAEAAALSSGMLFKATTPTVVGGVSCYPLYVKA